MKTAILNLALLASLQALAQTNQTVAEDFKPASTNQRGNSFSQMLIPIK